MAGRCQPFLKQTQIIKKYKEKTSAADFRGAFTCILCFLIEFCKKLSDFVRKTIKFSQEIFDF